MVQTIKGIIRIAVADPSEEAHIIFARVDSLIISHIFQCGNARFYSDLRPGVLYYLRRINSCLILVGKNPDFKSVRISGFCQQSFCRIQVKACHIQVFRCILRRGHHRADARLSKTVVGGNLDGFLIHCHAQSFSDSYIIERRLLGIITDILNGKVGPHQKL